MPSQNIWIHDRKGRYVQKRRAQTSAFFLNATSADFLLDIGCGEGFITNHFLEAGCLIGLDVSRESLLIAKRMVKGQNVHFLCADATVLPLKSARFHKVAMFEVLEHLPRDKQGQVCYEVDRILKDRGALVISVPNNEKITHLRLQRGHLSPLYGHVCVMNKEKIRSLLPYNYFLINSCHLINLSFIMSSRAFQNVPFKIWFALNNLLGKLRRGYWIMVKYQKKKSSEKK